VGKVIALIGALDTKGTEFAFLQQEIGRRGHRVLLVDTGVVDPPTITPDISREEVAAAGGVVLAELLQRRDRGEAVTVMARGATAVVQRLYDQGRIDGLLSMGGSAGTAVGTAAMRALPIGFPKVMVSTVASGDVQAYVGTRDIVMFPSVVDVAGMNRISRVIFTRAAGAICGMVEAEVRPGADKPLIGASMFGNTTTAVDRGRANLEKEGYEVLVFHSTGAGGQSLESVVADGYISAVLDITTTEWADTLFGGVMAAGPERGDAAARRGIPQVIAPGCVDMVNFWARSTVPARYEGRKFYEWNPNVTLMRTTPEENAQIGRVLAEKANAATGPVAFLLPLQGVSTLDSPGGEFWWPEANQELFAAIKEHVRTGIPVIEMDCNINDPQFADAATEVLLAMLQQHRRDQK
jgi:uncharacterized protein (UPF0261 family)